MNNMTLRVNREQFRAHIKRICKGNLRKKCKICQEGNCPFLPYVLDEIAAMRLESFK